jgi:hypothetical protein
MRAFWNHVGSVSLMIDSMLLSMYQAPIRIPAPRRPTFPVSARSRMMARWKRSPGAEDAHRLRGGELARHVADLLRVDAGDLGGPLRRVGGQALPESLEDGPHPHSPAGREVHLEPPREGGIEVAHAEGRAPAQPLASGGLDRLLARGVPEVEDVVLPAPLEVRLTQEVPVVLAHQQRKIRLLLHEVGPVEALRDDHVRHPQRQGGVGSDAHVQPLVAVHRRGVVVRRDADDLRSVVAGLPEEVRVRNPRVGRIPQPEEDQVRVEVVIGGAVEVEQAPGQDRPERHVPDGGPAVEQRGALKIEEGQLSRRAGAVAGVGRAAVVDHALGAVLDGDLDDLVRDLAERLVPGDSLPAASAALPDALEWMQQTRGRIHELAEADALLTATGIEVGQGGVVRLHHRVLLFAQDDPVLHEEVERAAGGAVHDVMGCADHAVPGPLLAVDILPAAVARSDRGRGLPRRRLSPLGRLAAAQLKQREGEHARSLDEASARDVEFHSPPPPLSRPARPAG